MSCGLQFPELCLQCGIREPDGDHASYCRPCRSKRRKEQGERLNKQHQIEHGPRYRNLQGYILVQVNGTYEPEHRVVLEQQLGREMRQGESVHHKNGVRDDNRPENLELWVGPIRHGQRAGDLSCPHCGKSYR